MTSRRQFLKTAALVGASVFVPKGLTAATVVKAKAPAVIRSRPLAFSEPTLDLTNFPKYQTPLVIPPAMPKTSVINQGGQAIDYYEIAVRQFSQQILPAGYPATTVWGYGSVNHPTTFNYPSFTIEAVVNRPVRVKWMNQLVDSSGNYLPHLLPVDQTLHWANPGGGMAGRDTRPTFTETPGTYTGPVPMVPHVHGAHVQQEFDGYAEAWYLPNANNIPAGYATTGTYYDHFKPAAEAALGVTWEPGTAVFQYPNSQRASTIWYHDHTLGMTRVNVYAGPAGFYLLRGGPSEMPAGILPKGKYEFGLAIQDRSFNADGSLFFPDSREYFDGFAGPYLPETDVSPIWNPEFFGTTMLVNGKTWPVQKVEPMRYRMRFLNGCNARTLCLRLAVGSPTSSTFLPMWVIGTEGGYLPKPVQLDTIWMTLAERMDVIVDFNNVPAGTDVYLINLGPDEPYQGGEPGVDFAPADPDTTGQVMKFTVGQRKAWDMTIPPTGYIMPAGNTPLRPTVTRKVSLNEMMSMATDGPSAAMLGIINQDGNSEHKMWMEPITENPALNGVETWEIYNLTMDAHPIHLHEIMFQVVNRQLLASEDGEVVQPVSLVGAPLPPRNTESGWKDTVMALPRQVTRIRAKFDLPGLYVWHCHIIDHEDNEMMRPYYVGPIPAGLPHISDGMPMP